MSANSQRLYAIVTPILYHEPIVQDLGLLLRGIEKPLPEGLALEHSHFIALEEELPLHKLHALALVQRLHLVHASSRLPVIPELRTNNKAYEFPSSEKCHADALARIDLDGWENTKTITRRARKVHGETFPILQHVEYLVLGPWDDERWTTYIQPFNINPNINTRGGVLPENEIESLLAQYEPCLDILRPIHTCWRFRHGLYASRPANCGMDEAGQYIGIYIVHAASVKDIRLYEPYAGPVRLYLDIGLLKLYENNLTNKTERVEPFKSYDWALYPIDRIRLGEEEMARGNASVEICLVSKIGDEAGLDLAVKVKQALADFHEEVIGRKGKERLWKGKVRVLVGDEIPVCPCCGSKD